MEPFERVVDEHGPAVLRVCRTLVGPTDADDVWSETFIAAMRAYPRLRPASNVQGWLVTIAYRKAIDFIRKQRRVAVPVGDLPETRPGDALREPADDELRAALDALPDKQRAAVVYHHVAGLPYAEVGAVMGTNETAARRSAADGIANLRKSYSKGTKS